FVESYRVNKELFTFLVDRIGPYLGNPLISHVTQVAAVLRFLATGSYQLGVAKDHDVNIGRSTFSKILHRVIGSLENLCSENISTQQTSVQINESKDYFLEKFSLPNIIGCVDGTHVKIVKPVEDPSLYLNRKGYFSINAMVVSTIITYYLNKIAIFVGFFKVCNYNMEILAIDATHPGACHDSFIWNNSNTREFFSRTSNSFVLADSGYALEPFVLTPYRSPQNGSMQHIFNVKHAEARNIVERTIGLLKSRFRCLQGTLAYDPKFVCKIINVCCLLHNFCRQRNAEMPGMDQEYFDSIYQEEEQLNVQEDVENATEIRDEIARSL
ncbi:hypothetical protein KR059_001351, partial [Drosophila kikkawai]